MIFFSLLIQLILNISLIKKVKIIILNFLSLQVFQLNLFFYIGFFSIFAHYIWYFNLLSTKHLAANFKFVLTATKKKTGDNVTQMPKSI